MTAVRLRLCDEDREVYGGPEWVTFDTGQLDDQRYKVLRAFEHQLDTTFPFLFEVDQPARTERWTAAKVWLARKLSGIDTCDFRDFDIKTHKVTEEALPDGDDADPPQLPESSETTVSTGDSLS